MAPIVKYISKYDSPKTKSIKQSGYLGKCYWFYVIYHMLLSTTVLAFLAFNVDIDPDEVVDQRHGAIKLYVEAIGAFHQHRVFLTVGVIDMIHAIEGVGYFTRKVHTLSGEEEAAFESAEDQEADQEEDPTLDKFFDDKFDFSRNYGETIGVFTSIAYYQVMHPTILVCGALYYGAKFYVDLYQITCQYSKPRIQYGRRARTTTTYIFWCMAIGQIGNVVYWMLLVEDYVVGGLMMMSLAVALAILILYKSKPPKMKAAAETTAVAAQRKAAKTSRAKSSKLLNGSKGEDGDGETGMGGFPEPPYNPPRPEHLQVGLALTSPLSSRVEVVNPMLTTSEETATAGD